MCQNHDSNEYNIVNGHLKVEPNFTSFIYNDNNKNWKCIGSAVRYSFFSSLQRVLNVNVRL